MSTMLNKGSARMLQADHRQVKSV